MLKRAQIEQVEEALRDTPIVMIVGPRQCGKSTLAKSVSASRKYLTFDDPTTLSLAKTNPVEFLRSYPGEITLDEVQRVPELFLPLKAEVDRERRPGRYLLTGSANVLHMPKIGDSLAGRIEVINLLPFSQGELVGAQDRFVDRIFGDGFEDGDLPFDEQLAERLVSGGFPEPSLRKSAERRASWFNSYLGTILDRDIRDISNIDAIAQMPRLFSLLATRAGNVLNSNALAGELQIPYTSLKRYLDLLELLYLLHRVPAWSANFRARILTKSPKVFLVDTGLLCSLAHYDVRTLASNVEKRRQVLENFVAMELKKQCNFSRHQPWLLHFRTVRNLEVDFVLETKDLRVAGVDIRPTQSLTVKDALGLKYLEEIAAEKFVRGVILYQGTEVVRLGQRIVGIPIQNLWA
jgi:uncharacterized protein